MVTNNLINVEENESSFQEAWDNYWHTDKTRHSDTFYKQQMDKMWLCVYITCANLCKKIYKERSIIVDDLDDVILDSTEYTMRFLTGKNKGKKLYRPKKLGTFCYLRCRHIIDDPKRIWYDKFVCLMPEDNYKEIDMEIEGDYE